jgi:predicted TIM-barrel fold metal-dependent hydrolase
MIVDSHVHVATADDRYPLAPTGIGTDWWRGPGCDVGAVAGRMAASGVDRAVLVQAVGPYGFDNGYVVAAAGAHPDRFAAVVAVDLDAADHLARIEDLASVPVVTGLRLFGMTDARRWLDRGIAPGVLAAVADLGLTAVLTVTADDLRGRQGLRGAIERAACPVVLDHCGFPTFRAGRIAPGEPVLALAELDHVRLKVTTNTFLAAGGDPAALVDQLAGSFGPGRLVWGSDHPQTPGGLPAAVALGRRAVRDLAPDAAARILGANAGHLFGLADDADRADDDADADLHPAVREALAPLVRTLAADGYRLEVVALAGDRARLDVRAGEGACEDCLVPKDVFIGIAFDRLVRAGLELALEVSYPADPADPAGPRPG